MAVDRLGSYRALAEEIAAELTPMYVRDGTSESFERVDMAAIVGHVLITAARKQPAGAVGHIETALKQLGTVRGQGKTDGELIARARLHLRDAHAATGGQS